MMRMRRRGASAEAARLKPSKARRDYQACALAAARCAPSALGNQRRQHRRRTEQHRVVDDEAEFRLIAADVAVLPDLRILRLYPQALQRAVAGTILQPDVELPAVGDRCTGDRIDRVPAL